MIKIVDISYLGDYKLELFFSTNESGVMDFSYLLDKKTQLTEPLDNKEYFKDYFIELGALAWKNGLELSPKSLYEKLKISNNISHVERSA
jgi:DUF971 family protein